VNWIFLGSTVEKEPFYVKDSNIWDYKWKNVSNDPIVVIDPIHPLETKQIYIYSFNKGDEAIIFAAGEFTYGIWGFYLPG
jgi:hypothetical protein